jgi:putative PIN family toxin of toxin-antitoxin system
MIERVVFDTSTLVGAALKSGSKPHRALMLTLSSLTLCSCEQELAELTEVLNRGPFERYLTRCDRDGFLALIRERAGKFWIGEIFGASLDPPCRDPKDNFILVLAVAADADLIVTSDQDLLVLNPWRGIPILTPAQFLAQFAV